jgi:hypothetical protein
MLSDGWLLPEALFGAILKRGGAFLRAALAGCSTRNFKHQPKRRQNLRTATLRKAAAHSKF